eukprot:CAMPEP_0119533718 /NCGR_PEP_ID=MMETSP1344-20130328/47060_1 /TAXON_ID=236787 /ORGANISM="Florenciella parvula, Strain CCMP2471" /LENGTH=954 /DNA_ID=CAMNT_0007574709 /DNA_START=12 /DNA_END=2872 /DNA_ORIENTATION=-
MHPDEFEPEVHFKLNPHKHERLNTELLELKAAKVARESGSVHKPKRVFRHAGKHEAKHEAAGLHLWYKATVPQEEYTALRGHASVNSVERVLNSTEARPLVEKIETSMKRKLHKSLRSRPAKEKTAEAEAEEKGQDERILAASPPTPEPTSFVMNDPLLSTQTHYMAVNIDQAWEVTAGDPSVIVQVIDSGIDEEHPDLQMNKWSNVDDCDGDGQDSDNNGYIDDCHGYNNADNSVSLEGDGSHGTHCAGTIAADSDNQIGVSGVAGGKNGLPGASLMINTVFGKANTDGFEDALVYGADNGAHISSNSWGYTVADVFPEATEEAIDYAIDAGVLVVFAAGNDGDNGLWYPGAHDPVIAVAAADDSGTAAYFTNYGDWIDITAPGVDVYSTYLLEDGEYGYMSGTSMACPHVSGILALGMSQGTLSMDSSMIMDCLYNTATDIDAVNSEEYHNGALGAGFTEVLSFVQCVKPPTVAPTISPVPTSTPTTSEPTSTFSPTTPAPSDSPTRSPTFNPTESPTTTPDLCFVIHMYDTWGDGWNGADFTWAQSSADSDMLVLQVDTLDDGSYGTDMLCVWWQDSVCYDFTLGSGSYDSEIYWNISHPLTEESWAGGGAPYGPVTLCGSDSMPPTDSPTMSPAPTPATWSPTSSEPTSSCPETCYGETCDFWDGQAGTLDGCDYDGNDLESYFGCYCGGCMCDGNSPTDSPTVSAVPTPAIVGAFTLSMVDSYGDGWNNAYYTWYQTDGLLGTPVVGTLESGSAGEETLIIFDAAACYSFDVSSGSYDYEISWDIADKEGNSLLSCPDGGGCAPGAWEYCPDGTTDAPTPVQPTMSPSETPAQVRLEMFDTYGDGWNGAVLTWALSDGSASQTATFDTGDYASQGLTLFQASACYQVTVSSGSYDYEISWEIQAWESGTPLLSGGAPVTDPLTLCFDMPNPTAAPTPTHEPTPTPTSLP